MKSRIGLVTRALVALGMGFGAFVLPFLLPPPPLQAMSAANIAGFNNRVAVIATALMSLAVLIAAFRLRLRSPLPKPEECQPMSERFVWGWALGMGLVLGLAATVAYAQDIRQVYDAGYFIGQMSKAVHYHLRPYVGVEFAYGPLLFYPTIWLRGLFRGSAHPIQAAYVVTLVLHEVVGIALLGYVMQALPIAAGVRRVIFAALALLIVPCGLGLNYTFLRFIVPAALIVFCFRQRRKPAVLFLMVLVFTILTLGISVEIGASFACGAVAFVLLEAWRSKKPSTLLLVLSVPCGVAIFMSIVGADYFSLMRQFANGAFNLIVEPQPYTLLYLAALVWIVPITLRSALDAKRSEACLIGALYASGLMLLPAAFGRADAGHIIFNGLNIFLLSLISVGAWGVMMRRVWCGVLVASFALTVGIGLYINHRVYLNLLPPRAASMLRTVKRRLLGQADEPASLVTLVPDPKGEDISRLRALTHDERVVAPAVLDAETEDRLEASGQYVPSYYALGLNGFGITAEQQMVSELESAEWAALPEGGLHTWTETPESTWLAEGLPYPYKSVRPPYPFGALLQADVEHHWRRVADFGTFILYHHIRQ